VLDPVSAGLVPLLSYGEMLRGKGENGGSKMAGPTCSLPEPALSEGKNHGFIRVGKDL